MKCVGWVATTPLSDIVRFACVNGRKLCVCVSLQLALFSLHVSVLTTHQLINRPRAQQTTGIRKVVSVVTAASLLLLEGEYNFPKSPPLPSVFSIELN